MVDSAGPVALHVAVAADRARPGALDADIAAQEQHVDDLTNSIDAVLVLREAEAPGDDHTLRCHIGVGEFPDVELRNAGALDQVGPGGALDDCPVFIKAPGVLFDEVPVEHGRSLLRRLEDRFGDASQ
jgi:hypothetical protein